MQEHFKGNGRNRKMRIKLSYPIMLSELTSEATFPEDKLIRYVCTDTRLLKSGDLFIALKGKKFNTESFAEYAFSIGATVIAEGTVSRIKINSTDDFIAHFIKVYKSKIKSLWKTVAITGSVGKTSTKTVLSRLLSKKFKVHATAGNQNNLLGTLFTLLSTPKDTELLILEFGMNHLGEISVLSQATSPDIAIITNIGTAHIGNLGNREMIAKAKLEIKDGMSDGSIVIPYREPLLKGITNSVKISFDKDSADLLFLKKAKKDLGYIYEFSYNDTKLKVNLKTDEKRLINAIGFSLGVCMLLKTNITDIVTEISQVNDWEFRQKIIEKSGYRIYDDTYSSSFEAVLCVVDYLIEQYGRISCVLSDMLELGDLSEEIHTNLGKELSKRNICKLYLFGSYAKNIAKGIKKSNSSPTIFINDSTESPQITVQHIKNSYSGELLLVKGSRNTHSERIIDLLIN